MHAYALHGGLLAECAHIHTALFLRKYPLPVLLQMQLSKCRTVIETWTHARTYTHTDTYSRKGPKALFIGSREESNGIFFFLSGGSTNWALKYLRCVDFVALLLLALSLNSCVRREKNSCLDAQDRSLFFFFVIRGKAASFSFYPCCRKTEKEVCFFFLFFLFGKQRKSKLKTTVSFIFSARRFFLLTCSCVFAELDGVSVTRTRKVLL